jgi:hypothetical protein
MLFMALKMNFTYKGVPIIDGYIRIVHWDGNKQNMYFNVEYYFNKETSDADVNNENYLSISKMYHIVPELGNDNLWIQAYEYLKTLPEFSTAIDW